MKKLLILLALTALSLAAVLYMRLPDYEAVIDGSGRVYIDGKRIWPDMMTNVAGGRVAKLSTEKEGFVIADIGKFSCSRGEVFTTCEFTSEKQFVLHHETEGK